VGSVRSSSSDDVKVNTAGPGSDPEELRDLWSLQSLLSDDKMGWTNVDSTLVSEESVPSFASLNSGAGGTSVFRRLAAPVGGGVGV
jgi:hypothetical protein